MAPRPEKIFLFVSGPESERPVITTKLPDSRDHALTYPEAFPTRYGLGKHGWVTLYVDTVPTEEREVLFDFVEESYRAVATRTLVKRLDAELGELGNHDDRPTPRAENLGGATGGAALPSRSCTSRPG